MDSLDSEIMWSEYSKVNVAVSPQNMVSSDVKRMLTVPAALARRSGFLPIESQHSLKTYLPTI
jgi:hypothetical protein